MGETLRFAHYAFVELVFLFGILLVFVYIYCLMELPLVHVLCQKELLIVLR